MAGENDEDRTANLGTRSHLFGAALGVAGLIRSTVLATGTVPGDWCLSAARIRDLSFYAATAPRFATNVVPSASIMCRMTGQLVMHVSSSSGRSTSLTLSPAFRVRPALTMLHHMFASNHRNLLRPCRAPDAGLGGPRGELLPRHLADKCKHFDLKAPATNLLILRRPIRRKGRSLHRICKQADTADHARRPRRSAQRLHEPRADRSARARNGAAAEWHEPRREMTSDPGRAVEQDRATAMQGSTRPASCDIIAPGKHAFGNNPRAFASVRPMRRRSAPSEFQ